MKIYAETKSQRSLQLAVDAAVVFWIALWIRLGTWIHELVNRLAEAGVSVEGAGNGITSAMESAGSRAGDLPGIGDALRSPFDAAAGAGRALARAGAGQQEAVHTLALWLGILIAVIPIGYVLLRYVPWRARWMREASAAARLRIDAEDLHLFALRAIATRPLYELQRVAPDPAAALAAGDYERLASLELGALGLLTRSGKRRAT
jgi:hypothetical protein